MDGAWRRPPKSLADYGHTEPKRGAEWWGKSPSVTLGLFSKVTRCKSGTNRGRYRRNGYVLGLIQHPGRPGGRHREQAPSHKRCRSRWSSGASPPPTVFRATQSKWQTRHTTTPPHAAAAPTTDPGY
ncbi:hypothetical protein FXO26_13360 [Pseudomonas synxantha]|uniref:Uncharacterized protein n=1 Tax=Pseudomonas synxantha TaxID=47883 RepID=A0A5D3GBJ1_9PSED|nr:hypothetical protein FXO26_13360 [Pseudomonas synxantha]